MNRDRAIVRFTIGLHLLNALLVAAHFLRSDQIVLSTLSLLTPLLFLYRQRISLIVLHIFSYFTVAIWLHTAWRLIMLRVAQGLNWKTAVAILGSVALITLIAGLLLNTQVLQERYPK